MNTLTFKQKDAMIKDIFKNYHKDKIKLARLETTNYYPSSMIIKDSPVTYQYNGREKYLNHLIDEKEELKKRIQSFEYIISHFDTETLKIIEHEYINQENSWWYDYYSKSTYYRNKNKAMNIILEFLVYE